LTQGQIDEFSEIGFNLRAFSLEAWWLYVGYVFYHSLVIYLQSGNAIQEMCRPCVGVHTVLEWRWLKEEMNFKAGENFIFGSISASLVRASFGHTVPRLNSQSELNEFNFYIGRAIH
jgi:hypothetical protein